MSVACVGITVLDRVFRVEKLPASGGKFVARDYFEIGGGPAATAAVAVARLGLPVEFIGRVGTDDVAQAIIREFDHYRVGHRFTREIDDATSSFSAILVDDEGERMIINYQDDSLSTDPAWMQSVDFAKFQTVLCDVRWHEGAVHALKMAKEAAIPSILDADITPQDISELVALADHVAFSEPGLAKFTQTDDLLSGLRLAQTRTDGKVYVTAGANGCYWLENGEVGHVPGFKVKVQDTTGAGDVFHGAFAFALAQGMDMAQTVRFASAVAALKCTKLGGREGIPDLDTVNAFLAANQ
ncbi:sugar kinase [uncultured Cohaesibacter sp.]|uniref:sugar kinase n=1 Tax=uncultured Cohaesibacter sp. TaxID=1002546 RepID=UPI0029C65013|nr:sugar kinase [uncultured Cohaesibacter sp.]